ncbi:hypothetical protein AQUCO_00200492v1 [Aquilegia coerulea]|uniref:2-oxoadipate dioxygenase/decarboxylase n=1 Tax=Aquilegia coerulea TaxID=218851 RepID=A0A2G5F3D0_AQUCA|nr:hypothetical protein AQUCO_00200492v1 [Aquilegia coerulea]
MFMDAISKLPTTNTSMFSSSIKTISSPFCSLSSLCSSSSSSSSFQPRQHILTLRKSISTTNKTRKRDLCIISNSKMEEFHSQSQSSPPSQGAESFFRSVLASMEKVYLSRNPTANAILELVHSTDNAHICYDHFAFRTFGVDGYGITSMAKFFLDFGYSPRDELRFPAKKLKALWFAPPTNAHASSGSGVDGPFPRIFISELLVDEMSPRAQEIIKKYTKVSSSGCKHAALASALGSLTWEKPLYSDFQELARESEYAAWTLVNGYALNHATISTHRLNTHLKNIKSLNHFIEENGFKLNTEGGVLKDGLLLQSSTVADSTTFQFADGITEHVPRSYIEFAERLVLPQYQSIPKLEIKEFHRREGFEVGNADKIFESTSKEQLTRKTG